MQFTYECSLTSLYSNPNGKLNLLNLISSLFPDRECLSKVVLQFFEKGSDLIQVSSIYGSHSLHKIRYYAQETFPKYCCDVQEFVESLCEQDPSPILRAMSYASSNEKKLEFTNVAQYTNSNSKIKLFVYSATNFIGDILKLSCCCDSKDLDECCDDIKKMSNQFSA
jgi:hypothetical protein